MMMKQIHLIIAVVLISLASFADVTKPNFEPYPKDIFMAFRSNNPHYWSFVKELREQHEFDSLFQVQGVGIGDFHFLNVADIELNDGTREIGLVDADDVGSQVPLFFDFSRLLISVNLAVPSVNSKEIIEAFIEGLQNKKTSSKYVNEALSYSLDKYNSDYISAIKGITKNNRFNGKSGIVSLANMSKEQLHLFSKMHMQFRQLILKHYKDAKFLDYGFRMKTSGGSKGIPRFLFLIEHGEGVKEVVEFKQFIRSSVEYYTEQSENVERFNVASYYYRPSKKVFGVFDLLSYKNTSFIARSILPEVISFEPSAKMPKMEKKKIVNYVRYLANYYGLAIRSQLDEQQLSWIFENQDLLKKQFKVFTKTYIETLKSLNKEITEQ